MPLSDSDTCGKIATLKSIIYSWAHKKFCLFSTFSSNLYKIRYSECPQHLLSDRELCENRLSTSPGGRKWTSNNIFHFCFAIWEKFSSKFSHIIRNHVYPGFLGFSLVLWVWMYSVPVYRKILFGTPNDLDFSSRKNTTLLIIRANILTPTLVENMFGSRAAISQPLTGISTRMRGRCVD
jgi:hypothetical protein